MNEDHQKEIFTYLFQEYLKRPNSLIDISTFFKEEIIIVNTWVSECNEKLLFKAYAFVQGKLHATVSIQAIRLYIPEYTKVHILSLLKGLIIQHGVRGARALLGFNDNHISQTSDLIEYAEGLGYIDIVVTTEAEVFVKITEKGKAIYEKYKDFS